MMAMLADSIAVRGRFARSANLERDAGRTEPFDGYIVTARALDVLERLTAAALKGRSGGAWSLTGPYGSGKSSLALLLDAALGPNRRVRKIALERIAEAAPGVEEAIRETHRRHGTRRSGFQRGLVTAGREPISHTLLRALHAAVLGAHGRIPSSRTFPAARTLRLALRDLEANDVRRGGPPASAIVEIARCLAEQAPLLLVLDEFGKSLESIRDGGDADPYVLQQLAEAGQGAGLPIFILTLQHLSFVDYLAEAGSSKRREWAKVQGRFEDVAFVDSPGQTRALIGSVFAVRDEAVRARIGRWAQSHARSLRELGMGEAADAGFLASCYPLHPLVALVLPELCSRYGQHERTLFSFLAGADPASAASFLADRKLPARGPLPSLGLDTVYDYFVAGGAMASLPLAQSSRWTEIVTRLRDIHGLSRGQMRLAKSIALLNLVSTTGTIRASRAVLSLADPDIADDLAALEARGVITYRDFADEYRIWQGTDIDIRRLVGAEMERTREKPLVEVLSGMEAPLPVVAARHSAQNELLRVFSRRFAESGESVAPPDPFSSFDGEVLLVLGSEPPTWDPPGAGAKPVVAAIPRSLEDFDRAAREVAAVNTVLTSPAVADDPVARGELVERQALAQVEFDRASYSTFRPDACRWLTVLEESGEQELRAGRGSAAVSEAADLAYPSTPIFRNEMLNRVELTSQGSRARRQVLEAMIERGSTPNLGFEGYGPDMAMYQAALKWTGLHGSAPGDDALIFRGPTDKSLQPAWKIVRRHFRRAQVRRLNLRDLYAALLSPPVGMKAGVVPVFLTAALLAHRNEIAIYEHGTFKPTLSPDLSERMVRNPGHFEIKHFANTSGARREVIAALAERLGVRPGFHKHRVANVVAIVGHLVSVARRLDRFTGRTRALRPATLAAREALAAAVEPDQLLFDTLPAALGFDPIMAGAKTYPQADAYAGTLGAALEELTERGNRLLAELLELLLETSAERTRQAISGQAAALEGNILNPDVRAFVLTLANDAAETDHDWIKAIATVVAKKAPAEWADDDLARFRRELPHRVAAFQRLVALHTHHRADGGGPFQALRVILTGSDGTEYVRLVGIDDNERRDAEKVLDDALGGLAGITGSPHHAEKTLLALLGERLLRDEAENRELPEIGSPRRRTHGA